MREMFFKLGCFGFGWCGASAGHESMADISILVYTLLTHWTVNMDAWRWAVAGTICQLYDKCRMSHVSIINT